MNTTRPTKSSSRTAKVKKTVQPSVNSFVDLLTHELTDLMSAETQIVEHLPKMIKTSKNKKLKDAFRAHLAETKKQVARLKKIFQILGKKYHPHECKGMQGILKEGSEVLMGDMNPDVRDAFIISIAQRVEHYEIAGYGTAKSHAEQLGMDEVADLLDETLEEESNADKNLSTIAEGTFFSTGVNKLAVKREDRELAESVQV